MSISGGFFLTMLIQCVDQNDSDTLISVDGISVDSAKKQFASKVSGTLNLYEFFKTKELDFVWITSSTASIIGWVAYGPYAVANRFIDGFIESKREELFNWFCVNLDRVTDTEININMLPDVLERTLCIGDFPQVIVSSRTMNRLVISSNEEKEIESSETGNLKNRPKLSENFVAPETNTEIKIAIIKGKVKAPK